MKYIWHGKNTGAEFRGHTSYVPSSAGCSLQILSEGTWSLLEEQLLRVLKYRVGQRREGPSPMCSPSYHQNFAQGLLVSRGCSNRVDGGRGNQNISQICSSSFSKIYKELCTGLEQIIMVELFIVISQELDNQTVDEWIWDCSLSHLENIGNFVTR